MWDFLIGTEEERLRRDGLDPAIVNELRSHKELLKRIKDWTVLPDKNLLKYLTQMSEIIDKLYKFDIKCLYRGVRVHGTGQGMDLIDETGFINHIKAEVKVGYKFTYQAKEPTSFSQSQTIAANFGKVIVKSNFPKKNRLVITRELNYCLGSKLFIGKTDMQEVVIYNNEPVKCEVLKIK